MRDLGLKGVVFVGLALTGLVGGVAACDDDDDGKEQITARLRVIHLSPDAPAVDVFANSETPALLEDLSFLEGTGYLTIAPGTYTFNISASGTGPGESVLDVTNVELVRDQAYTVVAFDELASLQAMALEDDFEELAGGDIRIRAIHAAVALGQVDVWSIPDEGNPIPVFEDFDFGTASEYVDLPAGAYTLGVDVDDDATPDVVFELPELDAGAVANVFAVSDATDVFLIAQLRDGSVTRIDPVEEEQPARLRCIHLSPDAPAVDVFADGSEPAIFENVAFEEGTAYEDVVPGTYTVNVAPAGAGPESSVLDIPDLELSGGSSYTAVAFDELASIQGLTLEDDYEALDASDIRVRAIHVASAVGQVDIWNVPNQGSPTLLYENVDFGVAGGYTDLTAGAYTLGFDVDDDASPDLLFDLPALAGGTVANVFAVSDATDVFLLAQLGDGTVARVDPRNGPEPGMLRCIHLSATAPAVDVFVDSTTPALIENLTFENSSNYLNVEPGTYTLNVAPAGSGPGASVLDIPGVSIVAGVSYTAVAFDELASIQAMLLEDDYENLTQGEIRVRAIHTAPAVGQVDIWNIPDQGNPTLLYEDVDFGVAGPYLDLPAGAYTLGFDVDNDTTPDLAFVLPSLDAGTVANVFAVSDAMGPYLVVQFADSTTALVNPQL